MLDCTDRAAQLGEATPRAAGNGIFAAGDWRRQKGPKEDISAQRPEMGDWFRVYGPEKAILDKSWRLPDLEKV